MKIEKDQIYNKWIVWMIERNSLVEMYKSKSKLDCKNYIRREDKKI